MITQIERNLLRENFYNKLNSFEVEGVDYEGRIKEGLLYYDPATDTHIVLKAIVKKNQFEAREELESYKKREEEREKVKTEKRKKREKKEAE